MISDVIAYIAYIAYLTNLSALLCSRGSAVSIPTHHVKKCIAGDDADVKIYEADMKEGGNSNNLMVQQCSQSLTLSMSLC